MAEHYASANSRVIVIGDGDTPEVFNAVVCLTDNSFDLAINNITTETKCGTINEAGTISTTLALSGVLVLDPDDDKVSASALFDLASTGASFNFKYGPITPVTGDIVYSGRGFLTAYGEADSVNTNSTFTGAIQVNADGLTKTVTA
jgi:hypothetical protein